VLQQCAADPAQRVDDSPPANEGSLSAETFGLVGRLGANLLFTPRFSPDEDVPAEIETYRQAIRAGGQDPAEKRIGGLDAGTVLHSMELTARYIIPHFKNGVQADLQSREPAAASEER
jgi:hypothetical protein